MSDLIDFCLVLCIAALIFVSIQYKKNHVVGSEIKRKPDYVIEAVAGRFILKDK